MSFLKKYHFLRQTLYILLKKQEVVVSFFVFLRAYYILQTKYRTHIDLVSAQGQGHNWRLRTLLGVWVTFSDRSRYSRSGLEFQHNYGSKVLSWINRSFAVYVWRLCVSCRLDKFLVDWTSHILFVALISWFD